MWLLYLAIVPIAFGILSLVASLICFFAYSFAKPHDLDTKRRAYPWFRRLLLIAFVLLSLGIASLWGLFMPQPVPAVIVF